MRRLGGTVTAALALLVIAGCRRDEIAKVPDLHALLPPTGEGTPNAAEVVVHLLSYPAADAPARFEAAYWTGAEEGILPADLRALWRANGLRLGVVGVSTVEAARKVGQASPSGGAQSGVHIARVPHRGQTVLLMTPPAPAATYLFTLPGGRTAVRSLPGSGVALVATCRLIDERTVYVELGPRVMQPGRGHEESAILDFLVTEVSLDTDRALLVGLGSALPRTVGRTLLTAGGGPTGAPAASSGAGRPSVQRLLVVTARPVHVPAGGVGAETVREGRG